MNIYLEIACWIALGFVGLTTAIIIHDKIKEGRK